MKNRVLYSLNYLRLSLESIITITLILLLSTGVWSQASDTVSRNRKQLRKFVIITTATYTVSMTALYQVWYREAEHQRFQFFNDNKEWKQVDKMGHFFTTFHLSTAGSKTLQRTGLLKTRADRIGTLTGFLMMLPIEIFDGFSNAYGASWGDLVANAGGSTIFFSQQLLWGETRIIPKFTFHRTAFANKRPELLGETLYSQIIKDYNGQTYWLSFDMDKFLKFPGWLNIAVGYGAEGMIYANDKQNIAAGLTPCRQYYLSLDIDLAGITTRSKVLKKLFLVFNTIRFPAPALEFSRKGLKVYGLYY